MDIFTYSLKINDQIHSDQYYKEVAHKGASYFQLVESEMIGIVKFRIYYEKKTKGFVEGEESKCN